MTTTHAAVEVEDLAAFRARARTFVRANLGPASAQLSGMRPRLDEEELASVAREREVQRMLFDAGLAGVGFPREYGGLGLTREHQQALDEELAGYEFPWRLQVPTLSPCAAVLLEFGTEAQKLAHIPAMLKGEELWMQMLSEPSGGSDVAAALTTAVRDGEDWLLNGSKIWTTGAWWSDWGLVLARTNWDVPKHRGLSVFILPLTQEGVTVHRIEMLNGNREFCQEFFSDVRVPDTDRVGDVDSGWTVGTRWMFHERMLHNSPFVSHPAGDGDAAEPAASVLTVARDAGTTEDPVTRDLIGEALTLGLVTDATKRYVGNSIRSGALTDQAAAVGRLFVALATTRTVSITFDIAGARGAAWSDEEDGDTADLGTDYLMRQASAIGGGTTEMARNVVAERVLGMPRELSHDRDLPFRDVPRS